MERGGIEVGAVGPNESVDFRINSHLIEYGQISQRPKKLSGQYWPKVNHLLGVVIELDPQGVIRFYLE
jgi:hypothetical protein